MKILITDDSVFMRKLLIKSLNKLGYDEIIEASNGREAVEKYREENPDLVMLDIVMKEEYGTEALKEIIGINPNAKIIMVSSVGQEKVINDAIDSGAKAFVTKPFKSEILEEKIKEVIG